MVKLGQLVSVKGGKRLPLGAGYSDVKTSFPYIRVTDFEKHSVNISNVLHLSADVQQKIARYTISSEDVYISIAGSIGIVGIVPEELDGANLTENAAKLVIIDKSKLDKRYLMRFLATAGQPQLHEQAKTTSQPKLALFRIEEVEIPLPPLAEQKRIAAILDKADAIRRKRQQAIQLADDFLRAVFLEMFGDPVTNPKGWEVKPLGSFCTLQGGYAFKSDEFSDDGIPLLKITNVHFEDAIWDDISYLPKEKLTDKSNFALECGDLVMAMTRPVIQSLNSVKIIEIKEADIPSLLNQRVGRFKGYTNVLNKNYLKYFLYSDYFKAEVEKLCSVALQPNVSSKQIESIQCCIPDLHAQENFSRTVEIVSRMLSKLHSFSKNNMLEALSQKAFSGQL
jgi:type I restriction enzyme S subunit